MRTGSSSGKWFRGLLILCLTCGAGIGSGESSSATLLKPAIGHEQVASVPNDGFPQVEAVVESDVEGEQIRMARACFRAEQHPDFYCVEMKRKQEAIGSCGETVQGNTFYGVLPIPAIETNAVVYYITATDELHAVTSTPYYRAVTSSEAVGATYTGDDPQITVMATVAGAPPIPPGFRPAGIIGFISVAGVLSSLGGDPGAVAGTGAGAATGGGSGVGLGVAAAVGAAASAAAGVAVLATNKDSTARESSTSGPAPSTTTSSTTTTSTTTSSTTTTTIAPRAPRACFTTVPDPPKIVPQETMTFNASCSSGDRDGGPTPVEGYAWDFGDGTPGKVGGSDRREVVHAYDSPGFYTVVLTVTNTAGQSDSASRIVHVENLPPAALSKGFASTPFFPSASSGARLMNVRLDGQSVRDPYPPGALVTVTLDFQIIDISCPGCIDQIQVGFSTGNPLGCIYSGIPGPAGDSGSVSFAVTAPSVPGVYFLGFDRSQAFSCVPGWWNGAPGTNTNRHFAQIAVQ